MKKLFIFAIAALGMLACTDKNAPGSEFNGRFIIEGEIGDIIGCWAPVNQNSSSFYDNVSSIGYEYSGYYYEFWTDKRPTEGEGKLSRYYRTFGNDDVTTMKYTGEKYLSDAYLENPWEKSSVDYCYDYNPSVCELRMGEKYCDRDNFFLEWVDGSHVYVKYMYPGHSRNNRWLDDGMYVRIDPKAYVHHFFKSQEKDYEKDLSNIKANHQTHFFIGTSTTPRWIRFSPGNLQYQASTNTWRFAEHQYDMIGSANANISESYTGWIDLFGRGTGNNPTLASKAESDYQNFIDWGVNAISNGGNQPNLWRTPTWDDWYAIISEENYFNYGKVKVAGICGIVLFPEFWVMPAGVTCYFSWTENQFSASEWSKMEAAGAIFLPAAGWRYGTEIGGIGPKVDDYRGMYWASGYNTKCLGFSNHEYSLNYEPSRASGLSVRLIQDVE